MPLEPISITTRIDGESFKDFSLFHSFVFQNILLGISVGSIAMLILAFVNWIRGNVPILLLCLGMSVVFPIVYYQYFKRKINAQVARSEVDQKDLSYTLNLDDNALRIYAGPDKKYYKWDDLFRVYRTKKYIYLYTKEGAAFTVRLRDLEGISPDELWSYIKERTDQVKEIAWI